MKNKNHYVIIMAGGIGSRFWPVSKKNFPKQFMDILGTGQSLITQTYMRFAEFIPEENIYIVTNKDYVELVQTHIPTIQRNQILEEPLARNTAPCIALATFKLKQINPNAICIIAPSDHLITQEKQFIETSLKALDFAEENDALVTLGIQPSRPDTGYGYIQYNPKATSNGINEVKTFTEKPTEEIAKSFIESGEFLWNAGIFVWSLNAIANRFEHLLPEIHQLFNELDFNSPSISNELEITYGQCPSISIDYGIMEKDKNVFVLPSNFGWSDLGTWKSLWDVSKKDNSNNSLIGNNIRAYQSNESLVFSNNDKLLVISGLENIVVVDSDDVLLIMNKDKEQELRNIVNEIKDKFKGRYN
jgi:mannose-1-phosphate guanylyltransferase